MHGTLLARCILVMLCLVASSYALACNVPVFRYALDHWRPDTFRALVISSGPLSESEKQAVEELRRQLKAQASNLEVREEQRAEHAGAARLVLLYPSESGIHQPVWRADLTQQTMQRLLNSPAREQLVQRLLAGQSTVWILVEGSDVAQNQAAAEALQTQLDALSKTLELPKLTDDPEDKIVGGPELRIEFSVLRVSRSDEREQALVATLLAAEPDLVSLDEPLVFPVFGCGRAMLPLVGAGITADNIRETALFLSGACSCQVKEQNPGFDLLISANWNELMPWTKSLPTNKLDLNAPPQLVPIPRGKSDGQEVSAVGMHAQDNSNQPQSKLVDRSTIEPWLFIAGFAIALGAVFILRTSST